MLYTGQINEFLRLDEVSSLNCHLLKEKISEGLSVVWALEKLTIKVDGQEKQFQINEIVFLTEFHTIEIIDIHKVRLVRFNRAFYCISDHDSEVGCKGILFFGASQVPKIAIPILELEKFDTLWKMFSIEMESIDDLKNEMLQMMLKRLLILCTRIYKEQTELTSFDRNQLDIVREYNYLVEKYFKTKHQVADYAVLLNRSPKTLSNLFKKFGKKSPLQVIQDRKILEARRLLQYSDKSIKEIAYEIGYEDIQTFSRFFKKIEGISPSNYKK
ncbi:transcriptional regulator, AraC family [Flavobacterium segetis]|uniref:Transcriptional regulator, AraC family n=1 Tax=Flavobacterium segetis TaxID=271157 RepID=A0A1M5GBR2_9FLAO|nr:helix-turn-helix domain-containing protein [Flavobacterium segetis]SHG00922.1 transcriptional regulator, AraC family [Flavobacterium segetis]